MKTLFMGETISQGGRSGTNQTPNGLQSVTSGSLRGGKPSLTAYSWSAQPGRSPVRGHDESVFMKSQLG